VKIAIIKKNLHAAGGYEKITRKILKALQDRGQSISLLTATPTNIDCNTLICPKRCLFKFRELMEFDKWCQKILKTEPFDAIFSMDRSSHQTIHRAGNGVHAAYLALRKQYESPFYGWTFPMNPLHRTILQLEKATFEDPFARAIIVNSHLVREQVLNYYATNPAKIKVIHNGVEWHEMAPDFNTTFSLKAQIARQLQLDPNRFHFLFVGHNYQRKGLLLLLKALSSLKHHDFHLSVVGSDKNPQAFQNVAHILGLSSRVTFFGPQTTLRPFYQLADALVLPSLYDPFANVTLEALAMGVFVITSRLNGAHEILHPFSGITLQDYASTDELVAALAQSLTFSKTPSSSQKIRASVQHLDWGPYLEKVTQLCS
jgi:UDP-glucose:(heptosyl)LPS alpha-1,3-glucosyltransferase